MLHDLNELRVADVATFLSVYRSGSLTSAARQLGVTPSQVSKAIARLEKYLKVTLVARKGRGVTPSDAAKTIHDELTEIVRRARALPRARSAEVTLTIGAPSFLAMAFFPQLAKATAGVHVRAVEAGGSTLRIYAAEDVVQMALSLSAERLSAAWISTKIGTVRQSLYTSPTMAKQIGAKPTAAALEDVPFVLATNYTHGEFQPGNDECPIPRADRKAGHEAATIGVAIELAAECDQLVYGPEVAARSLVSQGRLVEVKIAGFRRMSPLYLHVNGERVLARVQKTVLHTLREVLEPPK